MSRGRKPATLQRPTYVPLMMRLPAAEHAVVQELAAQENRSLNAQVLTLVQEALRARQASATRHEALAQRQ